MKRGHLSSVGPGSGRCTLRSWALSSTHLSIAPSPVMSWMGIAPVAQFSSGPSCGQRTSGACRSKRLTAGQHVPERPEEPAGDLDRGDLGAAFVAELGGLALEGRVGGGGGGGAGGAR